MTGLLAGLRWGESTALYRSDFDWSRGRLHVQRTYSEKGGRRCGELDAGVDDEWVWMSCIRVEQAPADRSPSLVWPPPLNSALTSLVRLKGGGSPHPAHAARAAHQPLPAGSCGASFSSMRYRGPWVTARSSLILATLPLKQPPLATTSESVLMLPVTWPVAAISTLPVAIMLPS